MSSETSNDFIIGDIPDNIDIHQLNLSDEEESFNTGCAFESVNTNVKNCLSAKEASTLATAVSKNQRMYNSIVNKFLTSDASFDTVAKYIAILGTEKMISIANTPVGTDQRPSTTLASMPTLPLVCRNMVLKNREEIDELAKVFKMDSIKNAVLASSGKIHRCVDSLAKTSFTLKGYTDCLVKTCENNRAAFGIGHYPEIYLQHRFIKFINKIVEKLKTDRCIRNVMSACNKNDEFTSKNLKNYDEMFAVKDTEVISKDTYSSEQEYNSLCLEKSKVIADNIAKYVESFKYIELDKTLFNQENLAELLNAAGIIPSSYQKFVTEFEPPVIILPQSIAMLEMNDSSPRKDIIIGAKATLLSPRSDPKKKDEGSTERKEGNTYYIKGIGGTAVKCHTICGYSPVVNGYNIPIIIKAKGRYFEAPSDRPQQFAQKKNSITMVVNNSVLSSYAIIAKTMEIISPAYAKLAPTGSVLGSKCAFVSSKTHPNAVSAIEKMNNRRSTVDTYMAEVDAQVVNMLNKKEYELPAEICKETRIITNVMLAGLTNDCSPKILEYITSIRDDFKKSLSGSYTFENMITTFIKELDSEAARKYSELSNSDIVSKIAAINSNVDLSQAPFYGMPKDVYDSCKNTLVEELRAAMVYGTNFDSIAPDASGSYAGVVVDHDGTADTVKRILSGSQMISTFTYFELREGNSVVSNKAVMNNVVLTKGNSSGGDTYNSINEMF